MPSDTIAALEWQDDKDMRCTGCGQSLVETVGEQNFDQWNAKVSHCDACRAISRAAHIEAGRDELDKMAGARFSVWRDSKTSATPAPSVSSNGRRPVPLDQPQ